MPRGGSPEQMARGRARMRELAAENEIERKAVEVELLASLGRAVTPLDRIAAESISAAVVRGRRLREHGRDDTAQRQQVAQLMRASGLKPQPIEASKPVFDFVAAAEAAAAARGTVSDDEGDES